MVHHGIENRALAFRPGGEVLLDGHCRRTLMRLAAPGEPSPAVRAVPRGHRSTCRSRRHRGPLLRGERKGLTELDLPFQQHPVLHDEPGNVETKHAAQATGRAVEREETA